MAAVAYNRSDNKFIFFHDNNVRNFIGYGYNYKEHEYMGKLDIPMYCERGKVGDDKFYTFDDFYNHILVPNGFGETWLYPKHNIKVHFDDPDNNVPYTYLSIKVQNDINHVVKEINRTTLDILDFVEMSEHDFNEMVQFMENKKYNTLLIKSGLKLFLTPLDDTKYKFCVFKGEPINKHLTIAWKDRYKEYFLPFDIPNYYKKFIRKKYIGGSKGEIFTAFLYEESWKNFFYIEPTIYNSKDDVPLITDYDTLSCLSKEQITLKEEKEHQAKLLREKQEREREENKHKDGYCDNCGTPYALYVENPFISEMYDRCVMQWLCEDCYQSYLGDI